MYTITFPIGHTVSHGGGTLLLGYTALHLPLLGIFMLLIVALHHFFSHDSTCQLCSDSPWRWHVAAVVLHALHMCTCYLVICWCFSFLHCITSFHHPCTYQILVASSTVAYRWHSLLLVCVAALSTLLLLAWHGVAASHGIVALYHFFPPSTYILYVCFFLTTPPVDSLSSFLSLRTSTTPHTILLQKHTANHQVQPHAQRMLSTSSKTTHQHHYHPMLFPFCRKYS